MLKLMMAMFAGCVSPGTTIKRPVVPRPRQTKSIADDVLYHVIRAQLHAEDSNWNDCNTHFTMAAKRRPRDPFLYMHWGNAARQLGQTQVALVKYKEALGRFGVHHPDIRAVQAVIDQIDR